MSEHNRGAWGVREDGMWWPGAITADQQQSLQQHQQILHQQQQLAAQQLQSTSAQTQQQIFSYKMASSFQNPSTNVSSTSPIGAAGIRGYDYRLGGGMGGNPTMSGPTPASQWWYPSAMDSSMQNSLQNNIQQNNMQNMPPVHTPPPVSQSQLNQQVDAQRQQQQSVEAQRQAVEAHRQQAAEVQRQQEVHRQQAEAHRQQEAHRQHQEAQRQYQEAQAHLHQQVVEAQARQAQLQQEHQQIQSQQVQNQQVNQSHHQNNSAQQQIPNLQAPPAPQKGRMPRGKADARPRGRMTAYAFFVQTCREEHKKKHPEENVVFAEFSKKCAERWKTMLDKEKKRFHEMAEKDKKRYDAEMQNYTPPKGEKQRGKKRKQIKDPNAPKRSLSAFFWFCNDERGKVKGANPEYGVGDIAKELGRRWAEADPETKAKYEAMAEKDKARYEKEMTAYKMKNNPNVQAPVPDHEEEEEEVEEDGEDDEDD